MRYLPVLIATLFTSVLLSGCFGSGGDNTVASDYDGTWNVTYTAPDWQPISGYVATCLQSASAPLAIVSGIGNVTVPMSCTYYVSGNATSSAVDAPIGIVINSASSVTADAPYPTGSKLTGDCLTTSYCSASYGTTTKLQLTR